MPTFIIITIEILVRILLLAVLLWGTYALFTAKKRHSLWGLICGILAVAVLVNIFIPSSYSAKNRLTFSHTDTTQKSSNSKSADKKAGSSSSDKKDPSKKSSKKQSSTDEYDVLSNMSDKELAKYNSGLLDSLSEEHGYADKGKKEYSPSLFIKNLKYNDRGLLVYVTDSFDSLSNKNKSAVATHAQQMANAQVLIEGKEINSDSMPTTSIYNGTKKLGRSTLSSDSSEFKWFTK